MTQPPNILILMIDQQKASALRLDKAIGIPAPAIERLAARGVRYEGCYTPLCGLFIHPWPSQMDKEPAQGASQLGQLARDFPRLSIDFPKTFAILFRV